VASCGRRRPRDLGPRSGPGGDRAAAVPAPRPRQPGGAPARRAGVASLGAVVARQRHPLPAGSPRAGGGGGRGRRRGRGRRPGGIGSGGFARRHQLGSRPGRPSHRRGERDAMAHPRAGAPGRHQPRPARFLRRPATAARLDGRPRRSRPGDVRAGGTVARRRTRPSGPGAGHGVRHPALSPLLPARAAKPGGDQRHPRAAARVADRLTRRHDLRGHGTADGGTVAGPQWGAALRVHRAGRTQPQLPPGPDAGAPHPPAWDTPAVSTGRRTESHDQIEMDDWRFRTLTAVLRIRSVC
jgi:hypothetical protein